MRISIIAVGTRMPTWVMQGVEEYDRRLPRELGVRWLEVPLARRGKGADGGALSATEGAQVLKAISPGDRVIALDVKGTRLSTPQLADRLPQLADVRGQLQRIDWRP